MTHALRCLVLAAAVGALAGGVARADLVLEFNTGIAALSAGDDTFGWKFTTNQAIIVTALDVFDPTGSVEVVPGTGNVRLYNGSGTILAHATVTASDPLEGSPVPFHSHAITPVTLAANQTYYIAQGIRANTTQFYVRTSTPTTSPLITYNGEVATSSGIGMSATPTSDAFGGGLSPGIFGPNFDAVAAQVVPEPSTMLQAAIASLLGLGYAWRRRQA
jgi:hypothetical protein